MARLSLEDAREIGIDACIRKIGYDFCKKHQDNATSSWGERDGYVDCFVGVSDQPAPDYDLSKMDHLVLTSGEEWPFYARCNVYFADGRIEYEECRVPDSAG